MKESNEKLVFTFKRIDHPAQDLAVKFHGFLMEQLDSDYVDYLHQQQTNPYATKVIQRERKHAVGCTSAHRRHRG